MKKRDKIVFAAAVQNLTQQKTGVVFRHRLFAAKGKEICNIC